MFPLPPEIISLLANFAPVFDKRVWDHAVILLVGAILSPGKRTVTAALRIMGLADEKHFINYHRVLSRATWSSLALSRILLGLLIVLLLSVNAPLLFVIDDTLERRRGAQIKAKGVFRDAVRSSEKHVVTCFGLRWVCMMLLVPLPWAARPWALPFLTVLAPSERTQKKNGKRHKSCVDWARQMLKQVSRWCAPRPLILLVDGGYAAVSLGLACGALRQPAVLVSRLRLDAALYDPPPPPQPHRKGRKPQKGARQASLKARVADPQTVWQTQEIEWYHGTRRTVQLLTGTSLWYTPGYRPLSIRWVLVHDPQGELRDQAFLCTNVNATMEQIMHWVILRWNIEVTFEEVRAHLGVETQRQWSDLAIARTTPCLLGLVSLIVLIAYAVAPAHQLPIQQAAWYAKTEATFADVIAFVRRRIWSARYFVKSTANADPVVIPQTFAEQLLNAVTYAA
jgi:DDE superfamily endonuclease